MLNADLIGFLLFEYTRNFLTCCKRMLGLEYEFRRGGFLGVEYGGRHVMVQVSPFGVSPPLLQKHMEPPVVAHARGELQPLDTFLEAHAKANGGQAPTLLAGVDYLDRFKGVQLKLLAWERLLQHYPKYQRGHVLVQICLASRNQVLWQRQPCRPLPSRPSPCHPRPSRPLPWHPQPSDPSPSAPTGEARKRRQ